MNKKLLVVPFLFFLTGAGFSAAMVLDPPGPGSSWKICRDCIHNELGYVCSTEWDIWTDCEVDAAGVTCIGSRTRTVACDLTDGK